MNKNDDEIKINKGIELMLRREKPAPKRKGAVLEQSFTLLSKKFQFKFEFTWEDTNI
jgi:hypothetical protein